jgi:hypothetical protein
VARKGKFQEFTMKIKMTAGLSGPKVSLAPGDIKDFADEKEAQRLIDAEFAELVIDDTAAPAPINETTGERVARLESELKDAKAAQKAEAAAAKTAGAQA